jgi:hypothetical protein
LTRPSSRKAWAELEPAAAVGRLLPQHPGQLRAIGTGVEQDRHGMDRQVMLHVQHGIVPQESPRKRTIVTRQDPQRRQDAAGVFAVDGHPQPVSRLFAAHRLDALLDKANAVEIAHRSKCPEQ